MARSIHAVRALTLTFSTLCAAGAVLAHHSYAMFDQRQPLLIEGSVARLEYVNPHSTVWLYAKKPGGKPGEYDLWAFEAASPGLMARYGWKRDTLKPQERVTVQFFPLRNGQRGGQFIRLFRADGSELIADPHAVGVKPVLDKGRPDLGSTGASQGKAP